MKITGFTSGDADIQHFFDDLDQLVLPPNKQRISYITYSGAPVGTKKGLFPSQCVNAV